MFTIQNEGRKEIVYENKDLSLLLEMEENAELLRSKRGYYYNIICAHDIETTSVINKTGTDKDRYDSLPYHFQTCIGDKVFFQRTLTDYQYFINELKKIFRRGKLVLFVHNLSFEFQHEKHLFNWFTTDNEGNKVSTVFSKEGRKVMKATTDNIEFRCSYFLTNKSLSKLTQSCKTCVHKKLDGDTFDYTKFRTPKTKLDEYELSYNYNDVKGLCECITEILQTKTRPNGELYTLVNMPLTSTGYVRNELRYRARAKDKEGIKYRQKLRDMEMSLDEYKIMSQLVFRGGDTHARFPFGGKLLHNVASFDIKSSYPAVMFYSDRFPITKFRTYYNAEVYPKLLKTMACYGCFRFKNIKCKTDFHNPYLSSSKCQYASGSILDNGRIFFSKEVTTWLTDVDLEIIDDCYEWEELEVVGNLRCAVRGYLPDVIRKTLLSFWDKKCELNCKIDYYEKLSEQRELTEEEETELEDLKYEYARSKEYLNAVYGMMVTDILNEEVNIDEEGNWYNVTDTIDEEERTEKEKELVHNSYCGSSAYKPYQVGVYVTAIARLALHKLGYFTDVQNIGIYRDTDSIKCLLNDDKQSEVFSFIEKLNSDILAKVKNCGIDCMKEYEYKGFKRTYVIGTFEYEGKYDDFVTLGAKRYCVGHEKKLTDKIRKKKNIYDINEEKGTCKEMALTVSGINKKRGAEELCRMGGIEYFQPDIIFLPNHGGKSVAHYIDKPLHTIKTKEGSFEVGAGICLTESEYHLSVSDTLISLFQSYGIEDVASPSWD